MASLLDILLPMHVRSTHDLAIYTLLPKTARILSSHNPVRFFRYEY